MVQRLEGSRLAELRESVKPGSRRRSGHAFLGVALRDSGDLKGARASLQRAIALMPPTAAVYVDLGITYLRAGDSRQRSDNSRPG